MLGEVIDASGLSAKVELASGRELRPAVGDAVVGASARGRRHLKLSVAGATSARTA